MHRTTRGRRRQGPARTLNYRGQEGEAATVLIETALNDGDRAFAEHWCMEVATRAAADNPLLGLAGPCRGHTAWRFGFLTEEAVGLAKSLAARSETDPSDVDGPALVVGRLVVTCGTRMRSGPR